MTAREFKLPFGKYLGETLEEVYIEDLNYLEWLLDKRSADPEDELYQKIHECFKEMRNVRIEK